MLDLRLETLDGEKGARWDCLRATHRQAGLPGYQETRILPGCQFTAYYPNPLATINPLLTTAHCLLKLEYGGGFDLAGF